MRAPLALAALVVAACACDVPPSASDPLPAAPPASAAPTAWPTVPAYDLDADLRLREGLARSHFDGGMETRVQDGVFVLAARPRDALLADSAQRVHEALAALLHGRFSRVPSRAVTVYVLNDRMSFVQLCAERLGQPCSLQWLGVWIKETGELLVNQELGRTTLVHELVHPLLAGEAPTLPRWLREGISGLMESPELHGLEIHGTTNWRVADLRRALASPVERELVHLDALFRMPDDLFDGDHALAAYAVTRFACQFWDSAGQDRLWRFYRTWRDAAATDPTGEKSFAEVFGQTPREADAAWQKWVRAL